MGSIKMMKLILPCRSWNFVRKTHLEFFKTSTTKYYRSFATAAHSKSIQQDDNFSEFYDNLTTYGLDYVVAKERGEPNIDKHKYRKTNNPKEIVVVGAGMAGLSAAYELEQAGHKTTILELQPRVGGRIKTIQFQDGQHAEGGAMRIPPNHFLTHHYLTKFRVELRKFKQYDKNGYLYIYGKQIPWKEWEKKGREYTYEFWPNWCPLGLQFDGIDDYLKQTLQPVKDDLFADTSIKGWEKWVNKWSVFSFEEFLRSTEYGKWSEDAITALKMTSYDRTLDSSLVEYLREELGGWWKPGILTTPCNGMEDLPKQFLKKNEYGWNKDVNLSRNIQYGVEVTAVKKSETNDGVFISGTNHATTEPFEKKADAAIVTVPFNILRQMDVDISPEQTRAIENVNYTPSTRVLLQCKTRFWQKKGEGITGGFTKTDLPIGQLHYPDEPCMSDNKRGVLMVYTWGQDALLFGSQSPDSAIRSAVRQISKIHPELKDQFEVGAVQAWYGDKSSQGAYVNLHPHQYNAIKEALFTQQHPVYLAGEAISWTHAWIQGALASGLKTAYDLYANFENN